MVEMVVWHTKPLAIMYPVVFFDALRVKIREDTGYLRLGIIPDCTRDIMGLWIDSTGSAKFWMPVFKDLKARASQACLVLLGRFFPA